MKVIKVVPIYAVPLNAIEWTGHNLESIQLFMGDISNAKQDSNNNLIIWHIDSWFPLPVGTFLVQTRKGMEMLSPTEFKLLYKEVE